jgi:hypothetical protein
MTCDCVTKLQNINMCYVFSGKKDKYAILMGFLVFFFFIYNILIGTSFQFMNSTRITFILVCCTCILFKNKNLNESFENNLLF